MRRNTFTAIFSVFVLAVLGSLVLLNVVGLGVFKRFDMTRDGIYTLSQATKDTLAKLEDGVTVTAYFTSELPAPYSGNARYVKDLLTEFRSASKGRVAFEFVDPSAQETEEDKEKKKEVRQDIFGRRVREQTSVEKELAQEGVAPVEIRVIEEDKAQTKRAYMGLVVKHQEKKEVIPVVQDVNGLEYELTTMVRKLTRSKTPVIGLVRPPPSAEGEDKLNRLNVLLSQQYELRPIDLGAKDKIDDEIDALWVVGPREPMQAQAIKAIDQFLMKGKSAAFFLDSTQVDLRTFASTPVQHGLGPLLASYGITLGEKLVADAQSAELTVSERRGPMIVSMPVPYPFVPILQRLQGESPISKGLSNITFPWVTEVSASPAEGRETTVLARSSAKSWLESSPYNTDPRRDWRSETITPTGPYNLMVQVSGKLTSHFAQEAQTSAPGGALLAQSEKEARLVVVGGSSILLDDFINRSSAALVSNVADWLLLDPALLAMRTRPFSSVPLKEDPAAVTRNIAKFGNALGIPLLLAAFGVVRWRLREGRRSKVSV